MKHITKQIYLGDSLVTRGGLARLATRAGLADLVTGSLARLNLKRLSRRIISRSLGRVGTRAGLGPSTPINIRHLKFNYN